MTNSAGVTQSSRKAPNTHPEEPTKPIRPSTVNGVSSEDAKTANRHELTKGLGIEIVYGNGWKENQVPELEAKEKEPIRKIKEIDQKINDVEATMSVVRNL